MTGCKKRMKRLAGRTCTGLLVVLLSLVMMTAAGAASYMQPYLDKAVQWGVMRGDLEGDLNENNNITRAEFSTMVNRAFGYNKTGPTPFRDVPEDSWYAEDVGIAYNIGYIQGTSDTTFSPMANITREQAVVILSRIMMLQAQVGEDTQFTDSRSMANWSRGYIATAAKQGLVSGYPDGSFGPQDNLTRGQAAILLVNALGTPLMEAGDYSLGSVWGNVTIDQSGTTLRNTVIGGNLYITQGVDLGQVTLENVTVLGKIVVSGGGTSEGGEDSIIMRNVTAPEMIVDNIDNHLLSVKVEGDGKIDNAYIRTNAYISDNTTDDCGIAKITMDGEEDQALTLAGNVKEVVNKAPNTSVSLASGQADTITVDEAATGSTLDIAAGSRVDNVNLDTGVDVTGGGDISKLTVNSNGSTVSMLPDQITIRPGNTANINGEVMDTTAAAESSADPRLYAGYPKMKDVAPTSGTAVFSANKKGTVYWALTAITDGSVTADELVNPSAYNPKVVKSGTVSLTGSGQEGTSNVTGLTSDGSYYLSAVFVDARDNRSPLKVISFTTPDNTKPDFASGYPYLSKITRNAAQVTAMATKSCRLYWAVLPKGASAPTAEDFKANAVTGNLGFGSTDVLKNTAYSFDVNNVPLDELVSYDLYLWLTDVDNGQSSAVKKLNFTTVDGTPPVFNTEPTINKVDKTSVGLYANLNEAGTLYWVVVAQGEEYPKPLAGQSGAVDLSSDTAKLQVSTGMHGLKSGKVSMTENKDVSFNVSGLEAEKAYDLYYIAQDKAGNFSDTVGKITIHTLDANAPTVTQEFTEFNGTDQTKPYASTDIRLVFSEEVQYMDTNTTFYDYYQDVVRATTPDEEAEARKVLGDALRECIKFYVDTGSGLPELVADAVDLNSLEDKNSSEWVIDYRYATVTRGDGGNTIITFPTDDILTNSALNLASGTKYYFKIEGNCISDTSEAKNPMNPMQLDPFQTIFAQVYLSQIDVPNMQITVKDDGTPEATTTTMDVDGVWQLDPLSTNKVGDLVNWDMIIWSDTDVTFDLYRRESSSTTWEKVNRNTLEIPLTGNSSGGVSLMLDALSENPSAPTFRPLEELKEGVIYQYAIKFRTIKGVEDETAWNGRVILNINVVAGGTNDLHLLASDITDAGWQANVVNGNVMDIGTPTDFQVKIPFTDQSIPEFDPRYPRFEVGASTATMQLALNRSGTIYYVVAPRSEIVTRGPEAGEQTIDYGVPENWEKLPTGYNSQDPSTYGQKSPTIDQPLGNMIRYPQSDPELGNNQNARYGNVNYSSSVAYVSLEGLIPETDYTVYFVLQNTSNKFSEVMCYRFRTTEVNTPYVTITPGDGMASIEVSEDSKMSYIVITTEQAKKIDPLNQVFAKTSGNGDDAKPVYMSQESYEKFTTNTSLKPNMTILEALQTTIPKEGDTAGKGPSVFDLYASDDIKDQVGRLIRQTQSTTMLDIKDSGKDIDLRGGNRVEYVDLANKIEEGIYYTCIAVAYNSDGTLDGFKAQDNITVRDKTPPTLQVMNQSATESGGKWSGTVTLIFSDNLYFYKSGSTQAVIATGNPSTNQLLFKNCVYLPSGSTVTGMANTPTSIFQIKYENITVGSSITIFADADAEVTDQFSNRRAQITLQFSGNLGVILNKDEIPKFKIMSGAIEGDKVDGVLVTPN